MREIQGAIIVGSIFQSVLGYSGLMSLLLRYFTNDELPCNISPEISGNFLFFNVQCEALFANQVICFAQLVRSEVVHYL